MKTLLVVTIHFPKQVFEHCRGRSFESKKQAVDYKLLRVCRETNSYEIKSKISGKNSRWTSLVRFGLPDENDAVRYFFKYMSGVGQNVVLSL